MSLCMYFNFLGSMPLTIAVALAIENSPQSFELPYGGKLWRVQTLADLAENRPTANF